ncbi:MAG: TonB-dependent receptor [Saprospiraceae bacterium]|nr:TonB-dependent receptor [Saprospiraceae bacterium]
MKSKLVLIAALGTISLYGQTSPDTTLSKTLKQVMIAAQKSNIERLPDMKDGYLWSGKKNEVINVQGLDANLTERIPRQIFAKVPGVFVYDMDGSGNQINISTRGLDPHRGWEFNIRANGVITNSDMYGYPASHFSLPMEAIERIELVRGTGALQYGAQFGGMLNYVMRKPDSTRTFGLETVNAVGSYGVLSTYNAISGKVGKFSYYAYYNRRNSGGYRENNDSKFDAQGLVLNYAVNPNLNLNLTLGRSYYQIHIAGMLNDSMFRENPRQASRSRNYYSPEIYVPSFTADWKLSPHTQIKWTISGVFGTRNSVMFDRPVTTVDKIDPVTLQYANRQVDIDNFNSKTTELRLLHQYPLLNQQSSLSAGVQYINNDLNRRQQGKGTTGSDYDLSLVTPGFGRDMHLKTQNIAFFAENKFQLNQNWAVTPGIRVESGASKLTGKINYYNSDSLQTTINHRYPLLGINTTYQLGATQNLYAGWSQAYRPVIFKDIIPGSVYEYTDKNLKDAFGYNLELGYRGAFGNLRWDLGLFELRYNNRLGSIAMEENGVVTILRTNIGDSRTRGIEAFAEYTWYIGENLRLNLFNSTAYFNAVYVNGQIRSGNENKPLTGKKLEGVPDWIIRNGLNVRYKKLSGSLLYNYTSENFADPLNTVKPSASGSIGLVPSYSIVDLNFTYVASARLTVRFNISNLLDRQYYTKRPTFYPGPGIWPSDGRSVNVSVGMRF